MQIQISNCNNIDTADILIEEGKLNIKYGLNGTGKSTIVQAINLYLNNSKDLSALKPFKFLNDASIQPAINGIDSLKSMMLFNEEYINQFVFRRDEVISNSFDIFIKTPDYLQKMMEIERIVYAIKNYFTNNDNLEKVIKDLAELSDSFGKSKAGYSEAGRISKAVGKGNKIENIPDSLKVYTPFLQNQSNVQWIKWQLDGNKYLNISDKCPYCTSAIIELKETILSVSKEYDSNSIQHLNKLIEIIENLGDYFSDSTKDSLNKIIKNNKGLDKESINYLIEVKNQIDTLKEKMISLKEISFFSIKDESNIEEKISLLKIDLDLLGHLRTPKTKIFVDEINKSLNEVLGNIGMLKGEINKQKAGIQKTIQKNKEEINNFLKYAGYSYYVDIVDEINSYKMKLLHFDYTKNIENSSSHLSFGEKNAFALVLFMYECISKNPDIIILDDPISSFDKNKKFAITEKLFRGSGSLQKRTVVMLTHDFEPIVDIVKTLKGRFQPIPSAAFLRNNNGNLIELPIEKNDIQSASNVCIENLNISNNLITKLIYTRRYFEIANNLGFEYHILSSLFHKREVPTDEALNPIPELDISTGISSIELYIPNFIYSEVYSIITDFEKLKSQYHASTNCYEKIQLFRIMYSGSEVQSVVQKFINETFHIENDYIMQLNPMKYEVVPQYIIDSCDELINAN